MNKWLHRFISITILFLTLCPAKSRATHIYGADLFYTHVTNNIYTVTLVIYGDCQAAQSLITQLKTATPQINVYNGTSFFTTITLNPISAAAGQGIEVTPVCPADINNTSCVNPASVIPGVRKYTYTGNVTLNATSANWIFNYAGSLNTGFPATGAGRSNTITNIVSGSTLTLNATLNNLSAANSSAVYTTIPTPFFCLNKLANYNPGAVDPNGDSLSFALVDAVSSDAAGNPATVTYNAGFSGANPLAGSSIVFNSTTGQYSFIPTAVQRALVVYTVSEYRNGVLVGTSQREMTYVVLNNCNNDPPRGGITNPSTSEVTIIDSNDVTACTLTGPFTFQINPVSPSGNNILVSAAGLPPGATFNVTNNDTTNPHGIFSWNTAGVPAGKYSFFVTYQDNGCPLSSRQTFTYSITVIGTPSIGVTQLTQASCSKRAQVQLTPGGGTGPWTIKVMLGGAAGPVIQTNTGVTNAFVDSFSPGTYNIRIINAGNCFVDDTLVITSPIVMAVTSITTSDVTCFGANDGLIIVGVTGGSPPYQYEANNLGYGAGSAIGSLDTGSYVLHIRDLNGCEIDTGTFLIAEPGPIKVSASVINSLCHTLSNGQVSVIASGGNPSYTYSIGSGAYGASSSFSSLPGGTYVIHTKDAHGCVKDTSVVIVDSLNVVGQFTIVTPLCFGTGGGGIIASATNGNSPYQYAFGTGSYSANDSLMNLAAGVYTVHIKDQLGCVSDNSVTVTQPAVLVPHGTVTAPSCYGGANGTVTISGSGGTPAYTYQLNSSTYSTTAVYTGLRTGTDTIRIKDANGCLNFTTVSVTQPAELMIDSLITSNALCYGASTGTALTGAMGGTPSYAFAANGGAFQTSNLVTGLHAGPNTIEVKDNNGCVRDTTAIISQPEPLVFTVDTVINPTCEGFTNGVVMLSASGGTPSYVFSINDSAHYSAVHTFAQLGAGPYIFYIKDGHNCTYDTLLTLSGYPPIVVDSIAGTNIACYSGTEGMIIIAAHGGVPPLNYTLTSIAGPALSDTFVNLKANSYDLVIKDSKNCRKDTSATITQPDQLVVTAKITPNACTGYENQGVVDVVATGGTSPYTYKWSTPDSAVTETITGLANGSYEALVKDSFNCSDSVIAMVTYDDCCKPFLPNAFTPNGDGKDDVFRLKYKGDLKLEEFWIYDRYGQRVYISDDVEKGWDGTYNGVPQNMDTYFYYVKAICGNRQDHEIVLKGDVTLVR